MLFPVVANKNPVADAAYAAWIGRVTATIDGRWQFRWFYNGEMERWQQIRSLFVINTK
jgi:hypothetical protein